MELDVDSIAQKIQQMLRLEMSQDGDTYTYRVGDTHKLSVERSQLAEISEVIKSYRELEGTAVATDKTYEVLVLSSRTNGNVRIMLREGLTLEDRQQGLRYTISSPSIPYLFVLYDGMKDSKVPVERLIFGPFGPARLIDRGPEREWTLFDLLQKATSLFTLRIESERSRPPHYWQPHAEATYFHLGYNLDVAFMPARDFSELGRPAAISRVRRSRIGDLDVPRRHYIRDLVHHYQLGVSADSPMLEYLSYYHVAEHWFENVFQDDLVEQIQKSITSPGFSYKRKRDVSELIRKVSKAVQLRNEEVVINEQVALRLTLEKHVDLDQLVEEIQTFNKSLVEHYTQNTVQFSDGDKVPLNSNDKPAIYTSLSKRIYKTRNSLVHSKDGTKSRFVPFADDAQLIPEVPLMRFIAEQIIVSSSSSQSS